MIDVPAAPAPRDERVPLPATVDLPAIVDYAAGMRQMLEQLRAEREELEQRLAYVREGEQRLVKAISALDPPPPAAEPPSTAAERRQKRTTTKWGPSQRKIADVKHALHALDRPERVQVVADTAGCSPVTAKRALEYLRETDIVRLVRVDKKYGAIYALMPDATVERQDVAIDCEPARAS